MAHDSLMAFMPTVLNCLPKLDGTHHWTRCYHPAERGLRTAWGIPEQMDFQTDPISAVPPPPGSEIAKRSQITPLYGKEILGSEPEKLLEIIKEGVKRRASAPPFRPMPNGLQTGR